MSNTRSSGFGDDANISRWINTPPSSDDESIELSLLRKPKSAILEKKIAEKVFLILFRRLISKQDYQELDDADDSEVDDSEDNDAEADDSEADVDNDAEADVDTDAEANVDTDVEADTEKCTRAF
jgi:hypothetical protein